MAIYWSPDPNQMALGVIKLPRPQKMTGQGYRAYLALRVEEMLEREPDRRLAAERLEQELDRLGFLLAPMHSPETAPFDLIETNPSLSMLFGLKGIDPEDKQAKNQPGARQMYEETSLEEWLGEL